MRKKKNHEQAESDFLHGDSESVCDLNKYHLPVRHSQAFIRLTNPNKLGLFGRFHETTIVSSKKEIPKILIRVGKLITSNHEKNNITNLHYRFHCHRHRCMSKGRSWSAKRNHFRLTRSNRGSCAFR